MAENYRANWGNQNLALDVYFSIILAGIGITWLALNDVPSGLRYITIFLVAISFLVVSLFFIDESKRQRMAKLIKSPFTTDLDVSSGLYLLGWTVPIILTFILFLLRLPFSVAQVMIPLSASDINLNIAQQYSVAEIEANPFWQWFVTVFTAGTIEEFVYGFILMLVGVIIGISIWQFLVQNKAESEMAYWFSTGFALLFTGVLFSLTHLLNKSYAGIYMFGAAVAFRVIQNIGIYNWKLILSFTIGYHQANNAIWFYQTYGAQHTINALSSTGGVILMFYFAILMFFTSRRINFIVRKIGSIF